MEQAQLIPHLFRTEFRKIVSVLSKLFGLEYIEVAEDIASDTFLLAAETWGKKGLPENPTAWLYTVAKNKTKDYLKRNQLFQEKISTELKQAQPEYIIPEPDLTSENIADSQLQMLFAISHPSIPKEAQIGLALRILCGLGIEEIADAFISNKETINKRLFRAKEKLKEENVRLSFPGTHEIEQRLQTVLTTLYLLFNEGYYSASQNTVLRKDLCVEALRLAYLLTENTKTNTPAVNALIALMCFHASRFEATIDHEGELVLYEDQDPTIWDQELILQGEHYLNRAATGQQLTKYHLEAAIAYWHTRKDQGKEKWDKILELYNFLLQLEYSPLAALNRTYALAMAGNHQKAIAEAEKLKLENNHLYYALLAELYTGVDTNRAISNYELALHKAKTEKDRKILMGKMNKLNA